MRPDLRATEMNLKRSLQNTSTRGLLMAYGWNPKCGRMRGEHSNPGTVALRDLANPENLQ